MSRYTHKMGIKQLNMFQQRRLTCPVHKTSSKSFLKRSNSYVTG